MASTPGLKAYLSAIGIGAVVAVLGIIVYTQVIAGPPAPPETPPAPTAMEAPAPRVPAMPEAVQARDAGAAADLPTPDEILDADLPAVTVFKSPTCGCCTKWADYMAAQGFPIRVRDLTDMQQIKLQYGVPMQMYSCHTAVVDGYVVEGHVPAEDVKRLLDEKPDVTGIAVPAMPIGSPGMEQGDRRDPYDVYAFTKSGETTVYAQHNQQ